MIANTFINDNHIHVFCIEYELGEYYFLFARKKCSKWRPITIYSFFNENHIWNSINFNLFNLMYSLNGDLSLFSLLFFISHVITNI